MGTAVPFISQKMDEIVRERVGLLREQLQEYISPSMRLHRGQPRGAKEFPDLGDVHNVCSSRSLDALNCF